MKKFVKNVGTFFDNYEFNSIKKILSSGDSLTRGKYIKIFEKKLKKKIGCKYLISTSSGSAALELTSMCLNLKQGDEVIVQSNSYWTAVSHLLKIGVKIICCDIDNTLQINIDHLKKLISKKTKAIYIFHHGGNVADVTKIKNKLKIPKNIAIIEDCAHCIGSKINNKHIGHNSLMACFSFSSQKNISTLGEGGAIATNSKTIFEKLSKLKDSNCVAIEEILKKPLISKDKITKIESFMPLGNNLNVKYKKLISVGSNFRMSAVEAIVGIAQMNKLSSNNSKRNKIAIIYNKIISKTKFCEIIKLKKNIYNSYHQYSFFIRNLNIKKKEELLKKLEKKGIECKIRFSPINWYPSLRLKGCKIGGCKKCNNLKNVENIWLNSLFSLPISPHISKHKAYKIANTFKKELEKLI